MESADRDQLRREAVGAFVHELRTPLTSMRMVVEIGRRASHGAGVVLDEELVGMLEGALTDLQELADALQETSRIERGKLVPMAMPCNLKDILADVRRELSPSTELCIDASADAPANWDAQRVTASLRGMAEAVNRCGNGSATVTCSAAVAEGICVFRFQSGERGGERKPVNADFGYPFFRGYTFITATGGAVEVDRTERHCEIIVRLPLDS